MDQPSKILAIKFKFLGDSVIMVPALRTLRENYPNAEIHVLSPAECVPVFEHIPWIDKVWNYPRKRGSKNFKTIIPLIRNLRDEKFDLSINFCANDRGAIVSLLTKAKRRIGVVEPFCSKFRKWCYSEALEHHDTTRQEVVRDLFPLHNMGLKATQDYSLEIGACPQANEIAKSQIQNCDVICHLSTSCTKKEWPTQHWVEVYRYLKNNNQNVYFTSGPSDREQGLLKELDSEVPQEQIVPKSDSLTDFIAILNQANIVISPDTAPLHLAAGLKKKTIGLFGATSASCWAPMGEHHIALEGSPCLCSAHAKDCSNRANHCLTSITPEKVIEALKRLMKK